MSQIKLVHSGGNSVIIAAPSSNPASDRTLTLDGSADGTILSSASTLDATKLSGALPAIDGSNLTGVGGGITHARSYRLHTSFTHTGTHTVLTNWEYSDDSYSGHLGSGWSLPSSGVFSFTTTGIYIVKSQIYMYASSGVNNGWPGTDLRVTINNSSFDVAASTFQGIGSIGDTIYVSTYHEAIVDVTDVSNVKFDIKALRDTNAGNVTFYGHTDFDATAVKVIRLGDT